MMLHRALVGPVAGACYVVYGPDRLGGAVAREPVMRNRVAKRGRGRACSGRSSTAAAAVVFDRSRRVGSGELLKKAIR